MTDLIPGQPVTGPRATITLRSSGREIDAGGDVIGLALDTDPPTVWHGYDGRVSLQIDANHDPEYDPGALTAAETAELASIMAFCWWSLHDRVATAPQARSCIGTALQAALACIGQDRQAMADAHTSAAGLDEDGAAGVAEYDEVLMQLREAQVELRFLESAAQYGDELRSALRELWKAQDRHLWTAEASAHFDSLCQEPQDCSPLHAPNAELSGPGRR